MARILVAMSGGVDSSVAAKLLIDEGHDVAGVTLKLYTDDDLFSDNPEGKTCCSLSDVQDARTVAYKLGIDHFVFNFRDLFQEKVIANFVQSYLEGNTPNPCIDCNRFIKFDKLIERAILLGYDYVATGHYALIDQDEKTQRWLLKRAHDSSKDQSYVLYCLTQNQLSHSLFPLGTMDKAEIRSIAEKAGLVNARKPDSQDICFVPDGNYPAFINKMAPGKVQTGPFIDADGKIIGTHRGLTHYTIGQRRGIATAFGKPMYVAAKDAHTNTITLGENHQLLSSSLEAKDINLISIECLEKPMKVTAKIRYAQREQEALISPAQDGKILVQFESPQRAVAPGQAVVFYSGETVVGGGTI